LSELEKSFVAHSELREPADERAVKRWVRFLIERGIDQERDLRLLPVELDDGGVVNIAGESLGRADVDA
jgi:hypothetical protein